LTIHHSYYSEQEYQNVRERSEKIHRISFSEASRL
jgi:hypothetical protein